MIKSVHIAALVVGTAVVPASASPIDLTQAPASSTVDGVVFTNSNLQWLASGNLLEIVRLKHKGTEEGYNTSGQPSPFDVWGGASWNRDLRLSDLRPVMVNGVNSYVFLLDAGEKGDAWGRQLSLDSVRLYTSPTGGKTTEVLSGLGTLAYNLDAASDSWIQLDSSVGTSSATIAMAVPVAKFSGAASGDFLYLYSRMGDHTPTSGGYESWSAAVVPAPGTGLLVGAGVMVMGVRRKRVQS